jgi:TolA-binding protein
MFRRAELFTAVSLAFLFTFAPARSSGASKEIQELQRDVAQLQDQLRQLQTSQDRQLTEIRTLVLQSVSAANDAGKTAAIINDTFQKNLRDQESKVVGPVVGLGTRMDNMSNDVRVMQQSIADLSSALAKIQTQLTELNNAVKVMASPPAPPPQTSPTGQALAPGDPGAPSAGGDKPTISANELYDAANRDRSGGKLDLAIQEYSDYLRWYGNTPLAPNAQYYIAWIHAAQGDFDTAVKEYDLVLEKYPDNNKTPDALYNKGLALVRLGRRTEGAREFQELRKRFPSNNLAPQACMQLQNLGYQCSGAPRAAAPKSKKSRH